MSDYLRTTDFEAAKKRPCATTTAWRVRRTSVSDWTTRWFSLLTAPDQGSINGTLELDTSAGAPAHPAAGGARSSYRCRHSARLDQPLTVGASSSSTRARSPPGGTLASSSQAHGAVLDAATHRLLGSLLTASLGSVDSVAFSPDGRTLASGSSDGTVELWDLATAKRPGSTLTVGTRVGFYTSVAFSPGGDVLAAGGGDGTVRLWDAARRLLGSLPTGSIVNSVAFSPGGRCWRPGSGNGTVRFWDTATASCSARW